MHLSDESQRMHLSLLEQASLRGFTLVEVMVALVIISIAMVTLLATHTASTRSYADAKAMIVCSMLAGQKLAELQAGDYPEAGDTSGACEGNEQYQWRVSVRETDLEELREVVVEVGRAPQEDAGVDEESALRGVQVETCIAELATEGEEEEDAAEQP